LLREVLGDLLCTGYVVLTVSGDVNVIRLSHI